MFKLYSEDDIQDILNKSIEYLSLKQKSKVFLFQIGGFDGVSFDNIKHLIDMGNIEGIIFEPIQEYFYKLFSLYLNNNNIYCANFAIFSENGINSMKKFNVNAIKNKILGPEFAGMSSFSLDKIIGQNGSLSEIFNNEQLELLNSYVEYQKVFCITFETAIKLFTIKKIDFLQIDAEGYDYTLIKLYDFANYRPQILRYENYHLSNNEKVELNDYLKSLNYQVMHGISDTMCLDNNIVQHI